MEHHTEIKNAMDDQLNGVKSFLKEAFNVDGEVTTSGKEVAIIEQDGLNYKGISFTLTDSERGEFKIIMCNPNPQKSDS